MKKKYLYIVMLICMSMFVGCTLSSNEIVPDTTPDNNEIDEIDKSYDISSPSVDHYVNEIDQIVNSMTIKEKVGQLVILGFAGLEPSDQIKSFIEDYKIGGVIFFRNNLSDKNQISNSIDAFEEINKYNPLPLFYAVDQEGGNVNRLPSDMGEFESAQSIGNRNDANYAYSFGRKTGSSLNSVGFNLNFAPSLDINSNPQNPVIGQRSYGDNEVIVTDMGIAVVKGLKDENIISSVKHFPGHGDTSTDSHTGLPEVDNDLERLRSFEFVPFQKSIDEGIDMIMTAHILLPQIDADNPATLSYEIVTNILRKEMGFEGVVITDDMTMGAITQNYAMDEAVVKAVLAGVDIVLVCHDPQKQKIALDGLIKAVDDGTISNDNLNESVARIIKLKKKYGLY